MSYWFLPYPLDDAERETALSNHEIAFPADGLPDLSKAQNHFQIAEWLRQIDPEAPPESVIAQAERNWKLAHELLIEDVIVVRTKSDTYMIGEIAGAYYRAPFAHILPVNWHQDVPAKAIPKLAVYAPDKTIVEIVADDSIGVIKTHVPTIKQGNAKFFRWMGIIILIFELIYFWPKN